MLHNNINKFIRSRSAFIFFAIFFKLSLAFTYINFLNPIYEHAGFRLDINLYKYLESWFIFGLFISLTPSILKKASDFYLNLIVFFFLCPFLILYSFINASRSHFYLVIFSLLIIFIFNK